ncbi:DUF4294 domain-containing protein [Flavobacterium sp.]|jgi:hypothetical protein|uniref:DUF4294 domain-containing protein n=1 Tax=Flavobacterium sp. TaxID=239 RepID=UPI0037C1594B
MFKQAFFLFVFFISAPTFAQVITNNVPEKEINIKEFDSIKMDTILLSDVSFSKVKMDPEQKKQFLLLQNRVYKVYPFAKTASDRLSLLNKNMEVLQSNKEKKRYFKIVEDFINNEFKEKLKKLSHKQGQILVKLIYRQTGISTYNLIKDYKSGWKAFWSNNAARLFDINLKEIYEPLNNNEDYLIETILYRAFSNGRLQEQKAANPVEIDELNEHWEKLAQQINIK